MNGINNDSKSSISAYSCHNNKYYNHKTSPLPLIILGSLISTSIITGLCLSSSFVSADDVVDEINITIPVSCSLSGVGMNSHNATINNGQYNSSIGETTIKAFCNDTNGFAIYAIGYTDDTDGKNVLTSSTLGSEHDIVTGTATSGNTSNWAMKLSTITDPAPTYPIIIAGSTADTDKEQGDPDYSSFQEVPDDYALVAKRTSGTDIGQSAEGATIKTTYQAYVSPTQSAGTYTGQVKYTLVHPNDAAAPQKPIYMQDLDSTSIAALLPNIHDTAIVYDKRDNQAYTIAKLRDGKYWMVENLNIAGGTVLSSEDTDFEPDYTLPTTDGWTVIDNKLVLPISSTSGYNSAHVYNSGAKNNCGTNDQFAPCYSYYSWNAATLGSGESLSINNADAPYSICPKSWRLPRSRRKDIVNTFDSVLSIESDYYNLAISYGMTPGAWGEESNSLYDQLGPGTIPNFLLAGEYRSSPAGWSFDSISKEGYYLSSTKGTLSANFPGLTIYLSGIGSNSFMGYTDGYSVRCLFKTN